MVKCGGRYRGGYGGKELKELIKKGSYQGEKSVGDYDLDESISSKRAKVYVNKKTGRTVVAHQGTQGLTDWGNNLVFALGGSKLYKKTDRFKEAEKVQKAAEKKYGNVDTIGHSQGGLLAELVGSKKGEIITVNKASHPFEMRKRGNQTDIRSSADLVSIFSGPLGKYDVVEKSNNWNPLTAHLSSNTIKANKYYGNPDKEFHENKKQGIMSGQKSHYLN
jgi:hypothetical protein